MRDKTGKNHAKVSPFDFFRKSTEYASDTLAEERFSTCQNCEFFLKISKQCVKCGCFMHLKTKLAAAECPIGKWGPIQD